MDIHPSLLGLEIMALVVGLADVLNLVGELTHVESKLVRVI